MVWSEDNKEKRSRIEKSNPKSLIDNIMDKYGEDEGKRFIINIF